MTDRWLLHAALPDDWAEAAATGAYRWSTRGRTFADEGFVHLSYAHQLDGVITRFYDDVPDLVILIVDRARLDDQVVDEPPAPGVAEHFPHLYGPIPLGAVVRTVQWSASSGVSASAAVAASVGADPPAGSSDEA